MPRMEITREAVEPYALLNIDVYILLSCELWEIASLIRTLLTPCVSRNAAPDTRINRRVLFVKYSIFASLNFHEFTIFLIFLT